MRTRLSGYGEDRLSMVEIEIEGVRTLRNAVGVG
jgi:hypothetical protein